MSEVDPNRVGSLGSLVQCPGCLIYGCTHLNKECNNYGFGVVPQPTSSTDEYQTEHILEMQLLGQFFDSMHSSGDNYPNPSPTAPNMVNLCKAMKPYWYQVGCNNMVTLPGVAAAGDPISFMGSAWPSSDNVWLTEFVLLENGINNYVGTGEIRNDDTFIGYTHNDPEKAVRNLKDCLTAHRNYLQTQTISARLLTQKIWVREGLRQLDMQVIPTQNEPAAGQQRDDAAVPDRGPGPGRPLGRVDIQQGAGHPRQSQGTHHQRAGSPQGGGGYVLPTARKNAERGVAASSQAAQETPDLIVKIETLKQQYNLYTPNNEWVPPF